MQNCEILRIVSYLRCPHCDANNRQADTHCYACQSTLTAPAREPGDSATELKASTLSVAFVVAGLMSALGAGLAFFWESMIPELPFVLEPLAIGLICSLAANSLAGKLEAIPQWKIFPRLGPSALFGVTTGLCFFGIWYAFDPAGGWMFFGSTLGFCCGWSVAVSFGLLGGMSRPMGLTELANYGLSLVIGGGIALGFADTYDLEIFPGVVGLCGLTSALTGARFGMMDLANLLPKNWD